MSNSSVALWLTLLLCLLAVHVKGMSSSWNQLNANGLRNRYLYNFGRKHAPFVSTFSYSTAIGSFPIILDDKTGRMFSVNWDFNTKQERLVSFDVTRGGKLVTSSFLFPINYTRIDENRPVLDVKKQELYIARMHLKDLTYTVVRVNTTEGSGFGANSLLNEAVCKTAILDIATSVQRNVLVVSSKEELLGLNTGIRSEKLWSFSNSVMNDLIQFGDILLDDEKGTAFVSVSQKGPSSTMPFYTGLIHINVTTGSLLHKTAFSASLFTKVIQTPIDVVSLDGGFILISYEPSLQTGNVRLTLFHEQDITHPVTQFDLNLRKYMKDLVRYECSNILAFTTAGDDQNSFAMLCSLSQDATLVNALSISFKFAVIDTDGSGTAARLIVTEENIYDNPRFSTCNLQIVTMSHGGGGNDNGDNPDGDYYGFICNQQLIIYSQSGVGEALERIDLDKTETPRDWLAAANQMVYLLSDTDLKSFPNSIPQP